MLNDKLLTFLIRAAAAQDGQCSRRIPDRFTSPAAGRPKQILVALLNGLVFAINPP